MQSNVLVILLIVFIVIALFIIFAIIKSKNKQKEPESSILDVDEIGVSNNQEFSYGYEKEETIVMDPVDASKVVDESKSNDDKSAENKTEKNEEK